MLNKLYAEAPYQLNKALELIDKGDFKKALQNVNDYLKISNSSTKDIAFAYYLRGIINEGLLDYKNALGDYRYAIYLNDDLLDIFNKNIKDMFSENNSNSSSIISNDNDNFYLAMVDKSDKIYKLPNSNSEVVSKLPKSSNLLINKNKAKNGFYFVFDIKTGNEGWVKGTSISFIKQIEATEQSLIDEVNQIYGTDSELTILNSTNKTLTLKIAENGTFKFKPNEQKTLKLKPGKYKMLASVPDASPHIGWEKLEGGYQYSIKYYIKTEFN